MTLQSLGQRPKESFVLAEAFRHRRCHQPLPMGSAFELGPLFMLIKLNFSIETRRVFPLGGQTFFFSPLRADDWGLSRHLRNFLNSKKRVSQHICVASKPLLWGRISKYIASVHSVCRCLEMVNHRSGNHETRRHKVRAASGWKFPHTCNAQYFTWLEGDIEPMGC